MSQVSGVTKQTGVSTILNNPNITTKLNINLHSLRLQHKAENSPLTIRKRNVMTPVPQRLLPGLAVIVVSL